MECGLIILAIIYVIAFIWNITANDMDAKKFSVLILTISTALFVVLFTIYGDRNTPTAKSVYEGKTTLEITYRDSIPVDTVVVLKPEFIKKIIIIMRRYKATNEDAHFGEVYLINGKGYALHWEIDNCAPCGHCALFDNVTTDTERMCMHPDKDKRMCKHEHGTSKGWNTYEYVHIPYINIIPAD